MSLTNPKTVVTEERLAEFYQGILPYMGGMPDILANKFSKSDLYSTEEKMIGQWIDGKPLYQKVIPLDVTSAPSGNTLEVYIDSVLQANSPIDCIRLFGSYTFMNGVGCFEINQVYPNSNNTLAYVVGQLVGAGSSSNPLPRNKINIIFNPHPAWYPLHLDVIVQYTKSTDSAIEIGDDTDYSTTEKIVGTWIDGKPIYQKTFDCGTLPNNTVKNFAHNISNLENIVDMKGIGISSGQVIPIQWSVDYDSAYGVTLYCNNTNIVFVTKRDQTSYHAYITLQYTKTS